ncbi:TRAP transporter substrate-binding protein [Planomicrobium sp. CPCC 101110]|uniref:TRAP transporter substrate-binding protein n=1 Tax=Planomicrobium sp. CPCC 101110 TaxID=2599619 RepID=UPI0011B8017B|nr:TRAP transporter substrate-binding protein [Planomicrobium sp. CPCC 101110]TWT27753.1 TRAP transporter substrate-binding protein [Planomicrobium sp. CPCC 101110]
MKMKTLSILVIMTIVALVLAACGSGSTSGSGGSSGEGTITLKLAENQPDDYPTTIGDKEFARLVEEKTEGRYKIEVYSGGQLGEETNSIEQVQLGSIDLARVNASPLSQFAEEIGVTSMPFLFESEEEKWEKLNGDVGRELLDTLDGSNMVGLAFYDSGERSFYNTKREVKTPEDMKGLKIRVQNSEMSIAVVEALGASATPMEYGEVYSSLQTGVIDGAENNFPSYYTSNHYEVAPYYTVNGYTGTPEVVIASQKLWDTLSDEDKELFREAALESVEVQREAWAELTEESKAAVVEGGSKLVEVDDIKQWRDAVQPVYDKYGDQYKEWIEKLSN